MKLPSACPQKWCLFAATAITASLNGTGENKYNFFGGLENEPAFKEKGDGVFLI